MVMSGMMIPSAAGDVIGMVIQYANGVQHALAQQVAHRYRSADDMGDGSDGDIRQARNLFDGGHTGVL
jgi:hypothetical protein